MSGVYGAPLAIGGGVYHYRGHVIREQRSGCCHVWIGAGHYAFNDRHYAADAIDRELALGATAPLVDNAAWLAGYAAYGAGDGCPWGNESARSGWIAARNEGTPS